MDISESRQVFTRIAASTPNRIPNPMASVNVVHIKSKVGPIRTKMISRTGMPCRKECPKLRVKTFFR